MKRMKALAGRRSPEKAPTGAEGAPTQSGVEASTAAEAAEDRALVSLIGKVAGSSGEVLATSLGGLAASAWQTLAAHESERNALEMLQAKIEDLRRLSDISTIGLTRCSRDLRYLGVNRAYAQRMGRPPEEIIGRSLVEVLGAEAFETIRPYVERVLRGEIVEFEAELPLSRGRRFIHANYTPDIDSDGSVIGWIASFVDVTERKRAEAALAANAQLKDALYRQLALITDTAPVFIAHCDTQARFKFVNKAYALRFGLTPQDCIGRRIAEIVGEQAYRSFRKHVDTVLGGQPVEFDVSVPYAAIGEHFMHCSYAPELDANGNIVGFVAALIDITERRRIEDQLRESEERLRDADRRKDEFLAMLAHELRNPLAPIANAVQLLYRTPTDDPVERQARAIIDRQAGRLAHLVDDLLEVSRITTGRIQLHMERIAIGGIVERALETVRPLIEQHRHTVSVSVPPEPIWLYGDAARLEQVVVNLLNNAAKYTDDGGRIEVTVHFEQEHAVLRVIDTGIGIDPELLPRVFDLFTQAERSLDRSHGGLGIGLSLVQRLAAMHGGEVSARSVPGQGSEFIVRLPASQTATEPASPDVADNSATTRPLRVLVVDDNVDAAQSLGLLLETAGHVVWMAYDGLAAFEAAREYRPHIVFLDIGLPEMDGYQVAKRLRQSEALAGVTLVAVTGYGQAGDRERSRAAGFDRHLVKPVDIAAVEQLMAQASKKVAG